MLGEYVIGAIASKVVVDVGMFLLIALPIDLLVWARDKLRPDVLRSVRKEILRWRGWASGGPGEVLWKQTVVNFLLPFVMATYTIVFAEGQAVTPRVAALVLGFIAVLIVQAANIRTRFAEATGTLDPSDIAPALVALPIGVFVAPLAWILYWTMALLLSPSALGLVAVVGHAITGVAQYLGGWVAAKVVAGLIVLLFGYQILVVMRLFPSIVALSARSLPDVIADLVPAVARSRERVAEADANDTQAPVDHVDRQR